jgi:hypothetical protein
MHARESPLRTRFFAHNPYQGHERCPYRGRDETEEHVLLEHGTFSGQRHQQQHADQVGDAHDREEQDGLHTAEYSRMRNTMDRLRIIQYSDMMARRRRYVVEVRNASIHGRRAGNEGRSPL